MSPEPSLEQTERGLDELVVALDGSPASITALRWAVAQRSSGGVVHAVHVVAGQGTVDPDEGRLLREAWVPAAVGADHSAVVPVVLQGDVASELIAHGDAIDADAIVVGHHERAHLGPQLVGHVTADLLHDADRPVVIVPNDWSPAHTDGRPVAVGVGVSKGTRTAVRWAMEHPRHNAAGIVLAHAHGPRSIFRPDGWLDVLAYHLDPTVLREWVEQDLLELAEQLRAETDADVEVSVAVAPGRTGAHLVEAGERASLLVVGRGEPPFIRSRTIAPYLRHAIVHAPCPIVVVPADDD